MLAGILAVIVGRLIGEQSYFLLAFTLAAAIFVLLIRKPDLVGASFVALFFSGLTAPGIPGKLNLFYLCGCCLIAVLFFQFTLKRLDGIQWSASHTLMCGFAVVLLATMLLRGAGFRALGSESWNGMVYVQLFMGMAFVFALPQAGVPPHRWRPALIAMGLMAFLPLFADALILLGADPVRVWTFIQSGADINQSVHAQLSVDDGVVRWRSAGMAGQALFVALMATVSFRYLCSFRGAWLLPLPLACLALTSLGGFRMGMLNVALMGAVTAVLHRAFSVGRIFWMLALAAAAWITLVAAAPHLPAASLRSVCWVPGVDVPFFVQRDADDAIDWRLELWKAAEDQLPRYWLVGKGFAYHREDQIAVSGANNVEPIAVALATSDYHNGPISLLISLGIFGFLLGIGFMIVVCIRHGRRAWQVWEDSPLQRCHQAIYSMFLVQTIMFLTLAGGAQTTFPLLLFLFALLEAVSAAEKGAAPRAPRPGVHATREPVRTARHRQLVLAR